MPGAQDGQSRDDELGPARPCRRNWIDLEFALLRVLAMGIERAHERAAGEIAGNAQVITGRQDGGINRRLDNPTQSQEPDVEYLLRERP